MKPILLALGATASTLVPSAFGWQATEAAPAQRTRSATPIPEVQRATPPRGVESPRAIPPSAVQTEAQTQREGAQQDALVSAVATFDRHAFVHYDVVSGTHWARGRTYKASADASGFTYIPFLGSDAPQNFPVHFQLTHVERNGATFHVTPKAETQRVGDRLVLDRGDVEVRYDLGTKSVEQSFAFAKPAGSGDVTLHLSVTSELAASMVGGELQFRGDFGGMNYGEAIVLDGAGHRAAVPSRWSEDSIELTVPAAFVDDAIGTIVVDPVFTTTPIDTFSADLKFPDLAYDAVGDRYLIVYEEIFSGGDVDVYSQFVSALSLTTSEGGYFDTTDQNWRLPKVAQHANSGRFMLVARAESAGVAGSFDIVARSREADGTFLAQTILKGATTSYGCISPDIGSEFIDVATSYYCVVYNRDYGTDTDVTAIIVDIDGNYVGSEITLGGFVSRDEGAPSVSKSTGVTSGTTEYLAAWPVYDLNTGESFVQAAQISFGGTNVDGPFQVVPPVMFEEFFNVEVSCLADVRHPVTNEQYWVVSYDDVSSTETDAFLALCSGTTVHSTELLQVVEHATQQNNDDDLVIGTLADTFVFAYASGPDLRVTMAQPIVDRLGMTERRLPVSGSVPSFRSIAIAMTYSGGAPFSDGLMLWAQENGTEDDIFGATVEASTLIEAAGSQYCYGAPNNTGDYGYMLALGDRDRFSNHTLIASSLPLNTFGYFLASTTQGNVPNAGGSEGTLCVFGSIGRFGLFNSGAGGRGIYTLNPQAIPQPMGIASAAAGQSWNFQSWHRDSVFGVATSNFTNAVAIPFL